MGVNMEELIQQMKVYLADNVAFGMKAQQYHWNVEGDDFPQYHTFLGNLYEEVNSVTDQIGEYIRTLDAYAPLSLRRLAELSSIEDGDVAPMSMVMMRVLFSDNTKVLNSLMEAFRLAERYNELGLANFLQDRMSAHKKHQWMLRSILKEEEK
jgi:starvation-inducible DNA-binding protein